MLEKNIKNFNEVLSRFKIFIGLNLPIDSKKLFSAWMIVAFPVDTIGKTLEQINSTPFDYPCNIYFLAKNMINNFCGLLKIRTIVGKEKTEIIRKFIKVLIQYSDGINYFLTNDKFIKINQLFNQHIGILKNIKYVINDGTKKDNLKKISDIQRPDIIEELNKSLDKNFKMIQKLDNKIKKDDLEIYFNITELKNNLLEQKQKEILIEDTRTKKLIFLPLILKTLKDAFYSLKAHTIHLENGIEFDDIFDDEIISRLIRNNRFTRENSLAYGSSMKFLINNLESSVSVIETNTEWDSILIGNYSDVFEYFAEILFFIMLRLRKIYENIESIGIILSSGINPFS